MKKRSSVCPKCGGGGYVVILDKGPDGSQDEIQGQCTKCWGSGKIKAFDWIFWHLHWRKLPHYRECP